ncbi:unnamed protein product [Cladocopium goreaui]|uniref:Histone-lysine N-methyltransferase, H3 lysine-79 specific n=1 Tax=Cladocopium goreaui TaxID=2562237 RepID=A0A9P1FKB8_9DINO|nr:unnamed protein product [Cladocopium goreaui]
MVARRVANLANLGLATFAAGAGVTAQCEPRRPLSAAEARRVVELFDRMMLDEEYGDIHLYDLREDEEHFVEALGGDATYGELSFDLLEWFLAQTEVQPEDVLCDLGSGSGRALIYLALRTGLPAVGVELSPTRHQHAEILRTLAQPFLREEVELVQGDLQEMHPFGKHASVVLFANKLFSEEFSASALRVLPRIRALLTLKPLPGELPTKTAELPTSWSFKQPVWLYLRDAE